MGLMLPGTMEPTSEVIRAIRFARWTVTGLFSVLAVIGMMVAATGTSATDAGSVIGYVIMIIGAALAIGAYALFALGEAVLRNLVD